MPELPEVEIVRQSLNKKIKQKKVKKVIVRNRNLRLMIPFSFEKFFINKKIIKVSRFSKYLILNFSDKSYCIIHLGMSGTIHIISDNKKNLITNASFYSSTNLPSKHNHVEIIFKNFRVIFNDPRRFGFFQIIKNKILLKERFKHLGPEPFENKFNSEYVFSFIKKKEKKIKNLLLDQNFVSGIGNIYASEILFYCNIRPSRKGNTLKKTDCKKIVKNSQKVLIEAIRKGGSSIRDFKNTSGNTGYFQNEFKVYQREGLNCKKIKCKGIIKKIIISNRSAFFCNICQK